MLSKKKIIYTLISLLVIAISSFWYTQYYKKLDFPTNKKIVLVSPINGIGNQLFFFAAAYGLSKRLGAELWVVTKFDQDKYQDSHLKFALDQFTIAGKPLFDKIISMKIAPYAIFRKNMKKRSDVVLINGANISSVKVGDGNIFYVYKTDSYWGAADFKDVEEDFKTLDFKYELPESGLKKQIEETESVAVHVRRGDFAGLNWVIPISFQKEAMQDVRKKLSKPHFFIFSDDVDYVTKEFADDKDVTIASKNDPFSMDQAIKELHLMSLCKHMISSNSTFSWWGAYLIKNPNKIIIAPKNILHSDIKNYYPASWMQMEYSNSQK